jgi:hypothetical protein
MKFTIEGLIFTDRSEVPTKVEKFAPELKKALIEVFENVLKPRVIVDPANERTLNKLNFIIELLKKEQN